jgi:hypothetical protein
VGTSSAYDVKLAKRFSKYPIVASPSCGWLLHQLRNRELTDVVRDPESNKTYGVLSPVERERVVLQYDCLEEGVKKSSMKDGFHSGVEPEQLTVPVSGRDHIRGRTNASLTLLVNSAVNGPPASFVNDVCYHGACDSKSIMTAIVQAEKHNTRKQRERNKL